MCKNKSVTFTVTTSAGGVSSYVWIVNGDTVGNNSTLSLINNGAHVEVYAVSDTCSLNTMYIDAFIIHPIMEMEYNIIVEECNQPVADIEIISVTGTNPPFSYVLYAGSAGNLGEQTVYPNVGVSSYPIEITDSEGCTDTTWINMEAYQCDPPDPIEAITPNEDGYNDFWLIGNIEDYPNNEVFIYDRWGQRVYHKEGYTNLDGWKAEYLGMDMPVSTYYYILKIKYDKQEEEVYNGAISVFR